MAQQIDACFRGNRKKCTFAKNHAAMIFDNKQRIDLLIRLKLFSILLFAGLFFWIYYAGKKGMEANEPWVLSAAVILYLLLYLIPYLKDLHYFRFSSHDGLFTFRYYAISDRIPKAIEFEANKLISYKFSKEWRGFRESLHLSVDTPKGRADYPPIRISLLTEAQRQQLEEALSMALINR